MDFQSYFYISLSFIPNWYYNLSWKDDDYKWTLIWYLKPNMTTQADQYNATSVIIHLIMQTSWEITCATKFLFSWLNFLVFASFLSIFSMMMGPDWVSNWRDVYSAQFRSAHLFRPKRFRGRCHKVKTELTSTQINSQFERFYVKTHTSRRPHFRSTFGLSFDLCETSVQQELFTQSVAEKNHSSPLLLMRERGGSFLEAFNRWNFLLKFRNTRHQQRKYRLRSSWWKSADVKIVTDTDVFFLQLFMLSLGVVKSSSYFFERNHSFGSATENLEVDFYEDL